MDKPKRSKFLGQYCKIVYCPKVIDKEDPDKRLFGMFDDETYSIYIEENLEHSRERDTLLHEVLHQLFAMSGLTWKKDQEETVTAYLGGAILSHIQENKKFWQYVMESPPPIEDDE